MKNPEKIKNLFNEISPYYDKINDFISLRTHYLLKELAIKLLKITPNSNIVDLCCGTGDFVQIISKLYPNCKILGVDFSEKMLEKAKIKNSNKDFLLADCTNLPFEDNTFDYITMGFGLRNIQDRDKAIAEITRVLKPNGKFLQIDFGEKNMFSKVFDFLVLFCTQFKVNASSYEYLLKSKQEFPVPKELAKEFNQLKCVEIKYYLFKVISAQVYQKVD